MVFFYLTPACHEGYLALLQTWRLQLYLQTYLAFYHSVMQQLCRLSGLVIISEWHLVQLSDYFHLNAVCLILVLTKHSEDECSVSGLLRGKQSFYHAVCTHLNLFEVRLIHNHYRHVRAKIETTGLSHVVYPAFDGKKYHDTQSLTTKGTWMFFFPLNLDLHIMQILLQNWCRFYSAATQKLFYKSIVQRQWFEKDLPPGSLLYFFWHFCASDHDSNSYIGEDDSNKFKNCFYPLNIIGCVTFGGYH